jgi:sporulation protein YlmC with PRC-barrel domain
MLQLSGTLANRQVLSLRTGGPIAVVIAPLINPNNLKIEGFFCDDQHTKEPLILLPQDIRDVQPRGFIINDHDVLAEPKDLVRLKDVLRLHFELLGKPVNTSNKKKLGKVSDYAFETNSMYIVKLYVGQSLMKSFSGGQLSIDRTQIVEITNRQIVVQDPLQGVKDNVPATAPVAS